MSLSNSDPKRRAPTSTVGRGKAVTLTSAPETDR